jgi:hypothetical protein
MRLFVIFAGLPLIALVGKPAAGGPSVSPDFNRDVRPILVKHCFKCHGPDDKQRQAGLRLDLAASAMKGSAAARRAIVAGHPEKSEVVRRISRAGAGVMPPATANNPLSADQKETIRRWISAGAEYRPHWAFVGPKLPPLPAIRNARWPRNPIDFYVLARLEREGLRPAREADRYTLIRRLSLDLIGLPPTPEEVDAFVNDPDPNAYERLVDRLLTSTRFGERWARRWLDLARYADTNGYEKDRARSIWPYRDWVIRAFNEDKPFDQFTIEQLAGDLLPNATLSQRVATGFHRNTMLNEEGGIDPLEYRFHAMTDRVATTATTWLGLTLGCAQCHTHKYDPIPQREYYQFMAFLDNADEPEIEVPQPETASKREAGEKEIRAREAALPQRFPVGTAGSPEAALERALERWVGDQERQAVRWTPLTPARATANLPLLTVLEDGSVLASGDQSKRDVYELSFRGNRRRITAIRLEVLPDDRLPRRGPGRVFYEGPFGDFFLSEVTASAGDAPLRFSKASHSFAAGNPGAPAAIDGDPQSGWSINNGQGKSHTAVFNFERPMEAEEWTLQLLFERYYAAGLGRFRIWATDDPRGASALSLPSDLDPLLLIPRARRSSDQAAALRAHFLTVAPELAAEREAIRKLRDQLPAQPTTLVFQERPAENPRRTFVRYRGEFLQPREQVSASTLTALPGLPTGAARNRLTFARWLVDRGNPLTGRVTVNRYWATLFGKGLVRTTEDFGFQGELPTQPELLDFLASAFVASGSSAWRADAGGTWRTVGMAPLTSRSWQGLGWSVKGLLKLIVTSATYRQSSAASEELLARDPQNRLLTRAPRFRLDAELLRDSALRAAGLLSSKLGGPSVFPPQPASITSEGTFGALAWKVSEGEDRYRRGLYTFSKRTAPYAMFTTFDGPSGEACLARRDTSNTALQALTLMNDQVFVEVAQELGRRFGEQIASRPDRDRIALLFRQCLTRGPTAEEIALLERFIASQRTRLGDKPDEARKVSGEGAGNPTERAAWTLLARSLLNLDEAIVRP